MKPITITSIGEVRCPFTSVTGGSDYSSESKIVISPELEEGLTGIEYFSHLWVIYHQHRSSEWLQARGWTSSGPLILPDDDDRAGQGVFSSRAPCRPAGLGSCIVALKRREGATLVVSGLDALDGTPVVDVKPYVPHFDAFPEAVIPLNWAQVMDRPGDATRLSRELHWDTSNGDLALGLRIGASALQRLGLKRGAPMTAQIEASAYFIQGFEMATGCSPLRGTLDYKPRSTTQGPWLLQIKHLARTLDCTLTPGKLADAAGILACAEDTLGTWTFRQA